MTVEQKVAAIRSAILLMAEHGDGDVLAIANAVGIWIDQDATQAVTLDACLGLSPGWRTTLRRKQRDAALLAMAERYFPGMHGREAARTVAAAVCRYQSSSWIRDRLANHRPDGLNGAAYDVLTLGEMPKAETLRRVLAG